MTSLKIMTASILFGCAAVCLTAMESCNNDNDNDHVASALNSGQDITQLDADLLAFASRQFEISEKIVSEHESFEMNSVSSRSLGEEMMTKRDSIIADIQNNFEDIVSKYDLTADLTEKQKQGLNLDIETLERMALDREMFEEYITEYRSPEFNKIYSQISASGKSLMPSDKEIIANNNLTIIEKITFILFNSLEAEELQKPVERYQPPSVIKMCHEMYLSAVKQCDQMYLVNNIGTLCGLCKDPTMAGVAEAATTFFVDSWNWVDCYDAAGNKEKRCWRTGKWQ